MCSYVTDRITGKKRLHFFVESSRVSSQKCTWFTTEGTFLLHEKTELVMMRCYAVLVVAFLMLCTEPKTFSLDDFN